MEALLNKIRESGLDASSVSGEEATIFWDYARQHIASSPREKAHCWIISAEYRLTLNQIRNSIDELRAALSLLSLPQDADVILSVKNSLSDRLFEMGDFSGALNEYVSASSIAVEHSDIDAYVLAILGMGNLCDAYGDHNRALRYYQKIDGIDHAISSRSLRLRYKLYMLACFIELRRVSAAHDLIKECEELSILVSDKVLSGQILLYQAKILRLEGHTTKALHALGDPRAGAPLPPAPRGARPARRRPPARRAGRRTSRRSLRREGAAGPSGDGTVQRSGRGRLNWRRGRPRRTGPGRGRAPCGRASPRGTPRCAGWP